MSTTVRFETGGAVALITLARPAALNALDLDTLTALRRCLTEVRDRDDLRVAILTGDGERAFCVGTDLKLTSEVPTLYAHGMLRATGPAANAGLYPRLMDLTEIGLWKPLIAAINGHCLGGGLELALQCDLRVAATTAMFGLPEAAIGSVPAVSGIHRLLKAIPPAVAMRMALTGERIDAHEAWRLGLVSDVHQPADLLSAAQRLATRIAANAPLAVQAVKRLALQTPHLSAADAQQFAEVYWAALRETTDRAEGRQAFAEKRAPDFKGE